MESLWEKNSSLMNSVKTSSRLQTAPKWHHQLWLEKQRRPPLWKAVAVHELEELRSKIQGVKLSQNLSHHRLLVLLSDPDTRESAQPPRPLLRHLLDRHCSILPT